MSAPKKLKSDIPAPSEHMPIRCYVIFDCSAEDLSNAMEATIEAARGYGHPRRAYAENIPAQLEFDV